MARIPNEVEIRDLSAIAGRLADKGDVLRSFVKVAQYMADPVTRANGLWSDDPTRFQPGDVFVRPEYGSGGNADAVSLMAHIVRDKVLRMLPQLYREAFEELEAKANAVIAEQRDAARMRDWRTKNQAVGGTGITSG